MSCKIILKGQYGIMKESTTIVVNCTKEILQALQKENGVLLDVLKASDCEIRGIVNDIIDCQLKNKKKYQ